jgi:hypothetical protein
MNDVRCVAHGFITFYFLIFYRWSITKQLQQLPLTFQIPEMWLKIIFYYILLHIDCVSGQHGGLGMITRPIWKCPCIICYAFGILYIIIVYFIIFKWNIELLQIFIFELVQYTFDQYFLLSMQIQGYIARLIFYGIIILRVP